MYQVNIDTEIIRNITSKCDVTQAKFNYYVMSDKMLL